MVKASEPRRRVSDPIAEEIDRLTANGLSHEDARALAYDTRWLERPSIPEATAITRKGWDA